MDSLTWLVLLGLVGSVSGFVWNGDGFRRQVKLELNPGLETPSAGVNLLHVRALGDNDTLHLLFCSQGAPTLLLVHTNSTQSSLHVNWPRFLNRTYANSVQVLPLDSVQYSGALVFTRLWEYDDVNNTADPQKAPDTSFLSPYELKDFTWDDLNQTLDYEQHTAELCGRDDSATFSNGSICLQFSAFESLGREASWPSLLHSANSSQLRVRLNNLTPQTNSSRFALELQSVSETGFQSSVDLRKSIDDEYTPSIFQVSRWISSPSNSTSTWGYTQWKPVAYRKRKPDLENATPCRHSEPRPLDTLPTSGLVLAHFGPESQTHGLNISFSMAEDPFYASTHFLSWTMLVGIGEPPSDFFSPLVIAVVAVGLGTPLVIILVGGVYVCVRKRRQELSGYDPIN